MNKFVRSFFFSNYFYGCCVLALSIETNLQLATSLNSPFYYLLIFTASVVYYTKSYTSEASYSEPNRRAQWYRINKIKVLYSQTSLLFITIVLTAFLFYQNFTAIKQLTATEWKLALIFPLTATLYYGSIFPKNPTHNLRSIGWLKPFVIGFVWTGVVSIYPLLYKAIENHQHFEPHWLVWMFFIKNFIFISILCILFDIKDYAADHNSQLKTFVVRLGLRKTLFYVIIPLALVSFISFIIFTLSRHLPLTRIFINSVPYILLITVTWSMQRRKTILYYLAIIDGLLLVKAACGILGVLLFK